MKTTVQPIDPGPLSEPFEILNAWFQLKDLEVAFKAEVKRVRGLIDEAVRAAGGEVWVPGVDRKLYIGISSEVEQTVDNERVLDLLLTSAMGDLGKVAKCLGSDPWKQGTIKSLHEEAWQQAFRKRTAKELKEGGAKRHLKEVDQRYAKKGAA